MPRYGLVIDVTRCNGCYNCQLACKDEFVGNDYPPYSLSQPATGHFWMRIEERERGKFPRVKVAYLPIPCMHCKDAPCIKTGVDGAVYQRKDGIVIIDPEKSKGKRKIVTSCPYGVIYWNDKKSIPQKCTLCAHLLDRGWKEPRCVEACPTLALRFGDLDAPGSEFSRVVASQKTEELHPQFKTKPRVSYIGVPKVFIAGSIVFADTDECGVNTQVSLLDPSGSKIRSELANGFGDFEFERIEDPGPYQLKVWAAGYEMKILTIDLKEDTYLGEIVLRRI